MRVPAAEVRATTIADQAHRWLAFATESTRMRPRTLTSKAFAATAFSVHHGASSLAIPSKLIGTSKHQAALWTLVREPAEPWAVLDLEDAGSVLEASFDGQILGNVQSKHSWIRPLLAYGLTVHLSHVTGSDYEAYTLGVNVVFGHAGTALDRLQADLEAATTPSGDGATTRPEIAPKPALTVVRAPGDGASPATLHGAIAASEAPSSMRLVVRHEAEVLSSTDPLDVVLYRSVEGAPRATCDHVRRHSDALDWGRVGSGPSDLALSVLSRICGLEVADRLYGAFALEVVAAVPYAGGVLLADDVRAWVEQPTTTTRPPRDLNQPTEARRSPFHNSPHTDLEAGLHTMWGSASCHLRDTP